MQSTENFARSLICFNDKETYNVAIKKLLRVFCPKDHICYYSQKFHMSQHQNQGHLNLTSSETLPSNGPH
uniref:Putative ovule protein n=1 Tax=Solanum chacoense TaxID=4108 RepID=A0A0V0HFC9_SOLCH